MGPKKKRKSKKQQREEELMAERLKREEAEERARAAEAKQRELEKQKMEAKLKAKREMVEQEIREQLLSEICSFFKLVRAYHFESKIKQREAEEWVRFLECNRLPFPESAPIMHTHLYLWKISEETELLDNAMERAETVLTVLNILDKLIEDPLDATVNTVNNWKEVRDMYRFELMNKIDKGCFHLMRKIRKNLNRIDFWTVDYKKSSKNITLGMWGWLDEPTGETDKRAPPSVEFAESGVFVRLPVPYNKDLVILRVIHTNFDHFSDRSNSWNQPAQKEKHNLMENVSKWYFEKERLKKEKELREKHIKAEQKKQELASPPVTEGSQSATVTSENGDVKESTSPVEEEEPRSLTPELPELITTKTLPKRAFEHLLEPLRKETETEKKSGPTSQSKAELRQNKRREKEYRAFLNILCPARAADEKSNGAKSIQELLLDYDIDPMKEPKDSRAALSPKIIDMTKEEAEELSYSEPSDSDITCKSVNQIIEEMELENLKEYQKTMETKIGKHELNLRKYSVLGGTFFIDLIKHVPQQFELGDGTVVQIQVGDYNIERDEFLFVYEPPKIMEADEDEEEKPPPDDNIDRLIYVEVTLPQHVLWFESPTVVLWNKKEKIWSSEHVYDIRFNEEKQTITCRIGKPDPLGLAAVRFNNLPFQTWELHPDWNDNSIIVLSLTASTVILEFLIHKNKVALQCLQNATSSALEQYVGEYYYPQEIIDIMKKGGVDLFPENDTFLYVEGHCVKSQVIEEHIYLCMAMFANVYQFTWSRWNMAAPRGMLVYQIREALSKQNLSNYHMVMSNLYQTCIVECSEVSPSFSEKSIKENEFHPDLYSLLCTVSSKEAMAELQKLDLDLIMTVHYMLLRTKVFSFS